MKSCHVALVFCPKIDAKINPLVEQGVLEKVVNPLLSTPTVPIMKPNWDVWRYAMYRHRRHHTASRMVSYESISCCSRPVKSSSCLSDSKRTKRASFPRIWCQPLIWVIQSESLLAQVLKGLCCVRVCIYRGVLCTAIYICYILLAVGGPLPNCVIFCLLFCLKAFQLSPFIYALQMIALLLLFDLTGTDTAFCSIQKVCL